MRYKTNRESCAPDLVCADIRVVRCIRRMQPPDCPGGLNTWKGSPGIYYRVLTEEEIKLFNTNGGKNYIISFTPTVKMKCLMLFFLDFFCRASRISCNIDFTIHVFLASNKSLIDFNIFAKQAVFMISRVELSCQTEKFFFSLMIVRVWKSNDKNCI